MKVLIVGAGEVGFRIAQRLGLESKDVVVIDKNPEALKRFAELLDVKTVHGSGSNPRSLDEAGVHDAETFLAVTDSDETNLIASLFADVMSPGIVKLVRIRNTDYTQYRPELIHKIMDVVRIISPELEVVKTIEGLMKVPDAEEIIEFADGRIQLIGIRIHDECPVLGEELIDLRQRTGDLRFIVAAIIRQNRLIIPTGKSHIRRGDLIYCVCERSELERVLAVFGSRSEPSRHILIIGGGNIGLALAQRLEKSSLHVRLIEKDRRRCDLLAEHLDHTIILNGDGTDQELLEEENIQGMDVVISVTGDEENNILSSLLSRQLGARRTITRINKLAYMPIAEAIGLGHIVSPRMSAVNTILRHIRKGKVLSAFALKGEEAEVLEAVALEHSGIVGRPLKDVRFPTGALVIVALRGEESLIPNGDTVIEPQDRVIILATRNSIPHVERELMVKLEYF